MARRYTSLEAGFVTIAHDGTALRQIQLVFEVGTVSGFTDRQLVERFVAGRDQCAELAFEALVRRHGPMVLRVCRSILCNHHDAQDAFQAVFLTLARRAATLWVRDSVGPWLHGVACRVATCSRAANGRRRAHERRAAEMIAGASQVCEDAQAEFKARLHEELGRLPERFRAPIVLCDLEGRTYQSVARELGLPIGTVKSRLARGRERLRSQLVRRGSSPSTAAWSGTLFEGPASAGVPSRLVDSTTGLATRLVTGMSATKVIPASIVGLMEGVRRMMFLSKLKVVAGALVIGCGLFSASLFCVVQRSRAESSLAGSVESANNNGLPAQNSAKLTSEPPKHAPAALPSIPKPWETAVRIKIYGERSAGFGSGTIIHSTPDESIILTAAHFFKLSDSGGRAVTGFEPAPLDSNAGGGVASAVDGRVPPSKFPLKISVDLFDGRLGGPRPNQVHFRETVNGEAVEYDFSRDVAMVRIKPGYRLPSSPVVPRPWKPESRMKMLTVGCSEGDDATWYTVGYNLMCHPLAGNPDYEAIECTISPKQGRAGGGLFTGDGYLVGVCNYSQPEGNRGLYAAPESVYRLLDRNGLEFIYQPTSVADALLDDQIRAAEEQLARDSMNLQRLKDLRGQKTADRAKVSDAAQTQRVTPADTRPDSEPAAQITSTVLPDHERRLRELERKLEGLLKSLDGPSRE
jgi:RNA polymerase sigma factor (sigma-70 family)